MFDSIAPYGLIALLYILCCMGTYAALELYHFPNKIPKTYRWFTLLGPLALASILVISTCIQMVYYVFWLFGREDQLSQWWERKDHK